MCTPGQSLSMHACMFGELFGIAFTDDVFFGCSLENWYYRILILLTGNLKNAAIAVDALSIW